MLNKYIIHLQDSDKQIEIVDTNRLPCWYDDYVDKGKFVYYSPTLKDIAIILEVLVGQGVQWQLSRELSKRTGFDLETIQTALENITREYFEMSDEEAIKKWEESPGYIETENDRILNRKIEEKEKQC
jgi:hypothetical protein